MNLFAFDFSKNTHAHYGTIDAVCGFRRKHSVCDTREHKITQERALGSKVHSLCYTRNGEFLALTSEDEKLILWEVSGQSSRKMQVFEGHMDAVQSTCFSPDARLLASASKDTTFCFWRRAEKSRLSVLLGPR